MNERETRQIVVEELTILAKALGGQSAANSYAIDSLLADQKRERVARDREAATGPKVDFLRKLIVGAKP